MIVIFPEPWIDLREHVICGGFLSHRATPVHHPFLDGIFPHKNQPFSGTPMAMETPIYWFKPQDLHGKNPAGFHLIFP